MHSKRNIFLLWNWIFVPGLLVLAFNDHYLKWEYSNWVTGKLSDLVGLLILPFFLAYCFPHLKRHAAVTSGLFFLFWKLPLSETSISIYNKVALIPITRVVDYTDLVALLLLPLSHRLLQKADNYKIEKPVWLKLRPILLFLPSSFVFMATSPPISYYALRGGDVYIGKDYTLKTGKHQVLERLQRRGFQVRRDTTRSHHSSFDDYVIENAVLPGNPDTIQSISFSLTGDSIRTILLLNHVSLKGEEKLSNWRVLKRYAKHYQKLLKEEIIEDIKKAGK